VLEYLLHTSGDSPFTYVINKTNSEIFIYIQCSQARLRLIGVETKQLTVKESV